MIATTATITVLVAATSGSGSRNDFENFLIFVARSVEQTIDIFPVLNNGTAATTAVTTTQERVTNFP
ncbi:MAG: hypothetical protein HRF40_11770 [Nitrososphaera sp.]